MVCGSECGVHLGAELGKGTGDTTELDSVGLKARSKVSMRLCDVLAVALERGEDTQIRVVQNNLPMNDKKAVVNILCLIQQTVISLIKLN